MSVDEERNDECASDVEPVERTMNSLSQLREHAGARTGDRPDLLEARRERADEQYQVLAQRQHAEPWGTHSTVCLSCAAQGEASSANGSGSPCELRWAMSSSLRHITPQRFPCVASASQIATVSSPTSPPSHSPAKPLEAEWSAGPSWHQSKPSCIMPFEPRRVSGAGEWLGRRARRDMQQQQQQQQQPEGCAWEG